MTDVCPPCVSQARQCQQSEVACSESTLSFPLPSNTVGRFLLGDLGLRSAQVMEWYMSNSSLYLTLCPLQKQPGQPSLVDWAQ